MQRRTGTMVAAGTAVLALGLSACAPSNTPTSYSQPVVEKNFLQSCLNRYVNLVNDTLAVTSDTLSTGVVGGSQSQCECQFNVFVTQVPFNSSDTTVSGYSGPNFIDLNESLQGDNPGEAFNALPASVQSDINACAQTGPTSGSGPTLPTEPTTTLPPGTQNTTPDGRPLDG